MAPKDYVTRSQPSKGKKKNTANSRTRKPAKNQRTPLPWFKILLAIALIVGFAVSLFYLGQMSQSESNETIDETDAQVVENATTSLPLEQVIEELPPLPTLKEEEWQYIDQLPDYTVEVEVDEPVESDKQYIMQCGSFRTVERANELKAKLAFQGFESRIIISNEGRWHRVVLGPYQKKRLAEKHRSQLRSADIRGCKIW